MVFKKRYLKTPRADRLLERRPCLSNLLLSRFWQPSPEYLPHNKAAHPLSMVFRIHRSKSPGAKASARERPCLEHVQLHLRLSAALFLSLVSFKKRIPWGIQRGFCGLALAQPNGMDKASCLISMVFEICRPKSAGTHTPIQKKPCLSNLLLSRFWQPSPEYLPHNKAANLISMVSILAA